MLSKFKLKYKVVEQKITVDKQRNIKIFVAVISGKNTAGTPTLLFPGGPGGDSTIYHKDVPFMTQFGPVILIDPRGTGESDKLYPEFWNLEHHVEDLEIVRKELKLNKFNFLGRSYGGVVAQAYALKYQEYLEKLLLIVTFSDFHFLEIAEKKVQALDNPQIKESALHILNGTIKDAQHMKQVFTDTDPIYSIKAKNDPKLLKKLAKNNGTNFCYKNLNIGFTGYLRSFDVTNRLKNIKTPTLVIGGKYDWICDASYSYKIAMNIENSILVLLPSGHRVTMDCKTEYRLAVKSFLTNKL